MQMFSLLLLILDKTGASGGADSQLAAPRIFVG